MNDTVLTSIPLRVACGLAVASLALGASFASSAADISPVQLQALSPVCKALRGTEGTRGDRLRPYAQVLAGSCGLGHTCNGEQYLAQYRELMVQPTPSDPKAAAKLKRDRSHALGRAASEFSYEIRCAPASYGLLPQIHTGRGTALSLAGKHMEAVKDFQRALQLNPNYAPAKQALAEAQARAIAAPPPRR